jgi:hypothetical protein
MKKINWGIIGGGQIAKIFAESINHSSHGKLISVASKNFENRNYFLKNFNSDLKIFDSYDDLLNDGNIDVPMIRYMGGFDRLVNEAEFELLKAYEKFRLKNKQSIYCVFHSSILFESTLYIPLERSCTNVAP